MIYNMGGRNIILTYDFVTKLEYNKVHFEVHSPIQIGRLVLQFYLSSG